METCFKILQLKFDKKLTNRCIGLTLHISASTVFEVLARFKASSLSWPLPADISHDTLEKLIFPPKDTSASELVMPDMLYFDTEMRKPGVTRQLLWMEYKAQAWAGTGFGNLAIPRVGQEVIVDFLNGDPDQPIIMGRTYHQENRTPGSLPGTKTQMTIRSKTYKGSGFNELKFDDATGKEQVYIHAQKNMNTEVLNNRTTDVINNHAETIGNNQMIAVTNNQIETVGVNQIETVGSNQIIKVGSVQVETIGLVRALTVGVAYQTTVGGIMNTSVALMQSSQIGLHKSLRVGLGYDVKVGNNVTFTVGKTKKDDTGQTAIYSAGEHLELCCGKARLVLTKDGQIFLNGTKIHLQGKEQVNGDSLLINWNCAASKSPPKTPDEKQDTPDMREY
ncbi:type VI secretion system Vgr family protein [Shigella sonnei]|uniref:type VI secretion system Vgr family protein n=1 Tax=Shigella sonnei TaxID=624 RepID=UPI0009730718|nr:phage baseplate assembly protein V [Shigella sonnei]SJE82225.1 Rhs element protein [Shigella sonnei]